MPLTKIQTEILRLLASHRDTESYVGGSIPLNRGAQRYSEDIDVFHDREERVVAAAVEDSTILMSAGFQINWKRQESLIHTADVSRDEASTRLEWVVDSDYRFFPTVRDEEFGYILHPLDLAMNKVMAAAGRRELRDIIDVITIHDTILPIGAVIWAAVDKAPGFNPEGLIAEIRRNQFHPLIAWQSLAATHPIDPKETTMRLRAILDEAEAFVLRMPTEKMGLLFLKDGKVVVPDPDRLDEYQTHAGQRRGHWPSSPEITAAMFEHYQITPPPGNTAD